jgi:hypothetical protein
MNGLQILQQVYILYRLSCTSMRLACGSSGRRMPAQDVTRPGRRIGTIKPKRGRRAHLGPKGAMHQRSTSALSCLERGYARVTAFLKRVCSLSGIAQRTL